MQLMPKRELSLARSSQREAVDTFAFGAAAPSGVPEPSAEPAAAPGPELRAVLDPLGAAAEQFRALRCELALRMGAAVEGHAQVLAVVGTQRGEGRTHVAAHLAISMAQRGGRVLLVDADLRRPRLHRLFGVRAFDGLGPMLDGRADYGSLRTVPQLPSLHLLPAGAPPAHPLELVERPEFALVMHQLRLRFTHIVLDTPAASEGPDAAVVAASADAALVVAQPHLSSMTALQRLQQTLELSGTPIVGAVFNPR